MLAAGADDTVKDAGGQTPADMRAARHGQLPSFGQDGWQLLQRSEYAEKIAEAGGVPDELISVTGAVSAAVGDVVGIVVNVPIPTESGTSLAVTVCHAAVESVDPPRPRATLLDVPDFPAAESMFFAGKEFWFDATHVVDHITAAEAAASVAEA